MIASGYTMDLYCEVEGHQHGHKDGYAQYMGETWAECAKQARKHGWKVNKQHRECICPKCVALGLKMPSNN